jgi:hypothetical protein
MVMAWNKAHHSGTLANVNTFSIRRITFNTHLDERERLMQLAIGTHNIRDAACVVQHLQASIHHGQN